MELLPIVRRNQSARIVNEESPRDAWTKQALLATGWQQLRPGTNSSILNCGPQLRSCRAALNSVDPAAMPTAT